MELLTPISPTIAAPRRKRWAIVAAVVLLLVAGAGAVWLWLSAVPVPLSAIRGEVTARLEALAPGLNVEMGALRVRRSPIDETIVVSASNVSVTHPDLPGRLRLAELDVRADEAAVLRGSLVVRGIQVKGVRGRIDWSMRGLRRALDEPGDGSIARLPWAEGLRRIDIDDARLDLVEIDGGLIQQLDIAGIQLERRHERSGIRLSLNAMLSQGVSRLGLTASGVAEPGGPWLAQLRLSGQQVDGFAANAPDLPAFRLDAPLRATATVRATDTLAVDGAFTLGAGRFMVARHYPDLLPFAGASGRIAWSKSADAIGLRDVLLDLRPARIRIDDARVPLADPGRARLAGRLENLSTLDLVRYWPRTVSRGGRKWIAANISIGHIDTGRLSLAPSPVGPDIRLDFRFRGLEAHYRRPMPPLIEAAGQGVLTREGVVLQIASGRINGLTLLPGSVSVLGFGEPYQRVIADFGLSGGIASLLAVLDSPPLEFISRYGVAPRSVDGAMDAWVKLTIPLLKHLTTDRISVLATARTRGAAVPNVFLGQPLRHGGLTLRIDNDGLVGRGPAALGAEPVDVVWTERFGGAGAPASSTYDVRGRIDAAGLRRLGIDLGPLLAGPVDLSALVTTRRGRIVDGRLWADLAGADLYVPVAGTVKPRGRAGRFAARVAQRGEDVLLTDLSVRADGLDATGFVSISGDGGRVTADIGQFSAGANDVSARVVYRAGQGIDVALTGRQVDLRPFLTDLYAATLRTSPPAGSATSVPVRASARLERTLLLGDMVLKNGSGALGLAQDRIASANLKAMTGNGSAVTARLEDRGAGLKRFTASADDAGAMAKGLGLFRHGSGGRMTIEADLAGSGPALSMKGRMRIKDFRVTKAPAMARTLTLASLTGLRDTMMGQGIEFRTVDVPFSLEGGVLAIKDGRAIGPALGVTLEGEALQSLSRTNFKGVIVPSYTLNALIGKIPLLGTLIVGGKDEGIIGFTYRIEGEAADPQVSVNAASGLAPGFLRNLFNLRPARVETK